MLSVAFLFEIDSDTVADHIKNVAKTTKNYWKGVGDRYLPTEERAKYISSLRQKNDFDEARLKSRGYKFEHGEGSADNYNKVIQVPRGRNLLSDRYTGGNEVTRAHEHDEAFEAEKYHRKTIDNFNAEHKPIEREYEKSKSRLNAPSIHMPRQGKDLSDYTKQIRTERHDDFMKKADDGINHFKSRPKTIKEYVGQLGKDTNVKMGKHVNDEVLRKEQDLHKEAGKKFGLFNPALRMYRHTTGEYDYINNPNSAKDTTKGILKNKGILKSILPQTGTMAIEKLEKPKE
jgi:hypothetical protein